MSKVVTPDGHAIEVVESYQEGGDPLLELRSQDVENPWVTHVKISQQNITDLMYELAKAKLQHEERT